MNILLTTLCFGMLLLTTTARDSFSVHKDHLKEELHNLMPEEQFDVDSNEEAEFHYFKIHDHNGDNKLDGLELGAAMTHYHESHEEGDNNGNNADSRKQIDISDEELEQLINQILSEDDLDDDGYVDFIEFVNAQRKHGSIDQP